MPELETRLWDAPYGAFLFLKRLAVFCPEPHSLSYFLVLNKSHLFLLAATLQFCMNVHYGRGHSGTDGIHGLSSWSCIVAEAFRPEGFESIQGNGFCSRA
eukprot:s5064_g2.t1